MYQAEALIIKNAICCLLLIQPIQPLLFVRGLFSLRAICDKWYIYDSTDVNTKIYKKHLPSIKKTLNPFKIIEM